MIGDICRLGGVLSGSSWVPAVIWFWAYVCGFFFRQTFKDGATHSLCHLFFIRLYQKKNQKKSKSSYCPTSSSSHRYIIIDGNALVIQSVHYYLTLQRQEQTHPHSLVTNLATKDMSTKANVNMMNPTTCFTTISVLEGEESASPERQDALPWVVLRSTLCLVAISTAAIIAWWVDQSYFVGGNGGTNGNGTKEGVGMRRATASLTRPAPGGIPVSEKETWRNWAWSARFVMHAFGNTSPILQESSTLSLSLSQFED